jgi:hypothetical protein
MLAGIVHAAQQDQKAAIEATKQKVITLHASLISHAAPPVRGKIDASAAAAVQYLGGCGRNCNLHSFLSGDLRTRFTRLTVQERDLVLGLVFGEMLNTDNERATLALNDAFSKRNLMLEVLTKMLQAKDETLMSTLSNIKP